MTGVIVPPSGPVMRVILSLAIIACITVPFFASCMGGARADTYFFDGTYTSSVHVQETENVQLTGLNLNGIANGSVLTYNMPIPASSSGSAFSEDGFSQSITGLGLMMTTSPSGVPYTQSDHTDSFGNSYREYVFNLTGFSGQSLYITATASFYTTITADAAGVNYTDPIGSSYYPQSIAQFMVPTDVIESNNPAIVNEKNILLQGVTTEAEAVDRIMDFVKTQIPTDGSGTAPDAIYSLSNSTGNCVNRAYLALALLRSAGIPARYVTGMVYGNQLTLPLSDGGYAETNWNTGGDALHVWVDVYYPDEQAWVPYDPYLEKGFVDTRHIISGISIDGNVNDLATHGDINVAHAENVNPGFGLSIANTISVSGLNDNNGFQYIYTEQQPPGQNVAMYARALQYVPFSVPSVTPVPSNNATTVTPKPTALATAVPTLVAGPDTSKYNLSGTVVDSITGAPISGAVLSLGAVQITSNDQGKFEYLYALSSGSNSLTVRDTGYVPQNQVVVASDSDLNITVKLTPAPDMNGTAVQSTPTPKPSSPAAGIILSGMALAGVALLVSRRKGT